MPEWPAELELIGGPDPSEPIVIVEYDVGWPGRFEAIAARIRAALGASTTVEHIGSTSVPGLAAKPIIDVLLVVDDLADEVEYVAPLTRSGLVLRAREPGHRLLRTPELDVHLHIYERGAAEIAAYLDLRDWLRRSPSDQALYAATKRRLAHQQWASMNDYAVAKTEVIAEILRRARRRGCVDEPS